MLANKKILITGATSGIGEALMQQYSTENYDVIACGRNTIKLEEISLNTQINQTLAFDITNEQQIKNAADKVIVVILIM